ncbi:unnamed protein product [Discula destructiva]
MATYTYTTSCTHHIELDLSAACALGPNSIQDRINDVVPGLKTSTAFFHFLRANLALQPSAMSSNVSTPLLEPQGLTLGPSPLARQVTSAARPVTPPAADDQATAALDDDIPPLSLDLLTSREDKVDALKLIADSIAQQRQRAAYSLILHPLPLAGLALALAVVYQFAWSRDYGLIMTLTAGTLMAYLAAVRFATAGYLQLAEELKYDFLKNSDSSPGSTSLATDEDLVLGTRYGNEIIGALVLRLEPGVASSPPRNKKNNHHRSHSLRGGKGVVRAWTVRLRYRGKGVGADLLHEAVRVTRERCGRDAAVGFAAEHANSRMVLPEMFCRTFRKGERRAAGALEKVLAEWEGTRKKR